MVQDTTNPEIVNKKLVRHWLWWSLAWLTIFPLIGLMVSIKFNYPDFLGGIEWFTFGRMRPVHVNGVIFGAFSTPFLGLLYYLIPKLCGRPMAWEKLGWWALIGWNLFLITGSISLFMGFNSGFEADEYTWPFNIIRFAVFLIVAAQVLVTVFKRKETGFYVSLWYTLAALIWTVMNLILGNVILPYVTMSGITNAALHGLFIHYVVGLWITPAGLAIMYYFMPLSAKNSLYSHRLSILGFWTLALFYPLVGIHHYLYSPIPHENQTIAIVTSMLLIIPVWAVITNLFGTARGRWGAIAGGRDADSYGAKFILLATFFYLVGCFQGSTEALRRMQELTHFSDFVISHSHFTVFGTFVLGVVGGIYYVWPRVTGKQLWSQKLASWHLWLTITGTSVMLGGLAAQGFIQGTMLENGTDFVNTVNEMKPWWFVRTLAGLTMDIGLILMVINFTKTALEGKPFVEPVLNPQELSESHPAGEERGLTKPTTVIVVAGLAFFFFAVTVQGILPAIKPINYQPYVSDMSTGKVIKATSYTPLEEKGRKIYIREGCWYCHSQYVRPVTGETTRWGPISQAGEYLYDQPHLLGTRRIGPDLTRIGLKYADAWHIAHHWNPRAVVPDSIMPGFPWLFKPTKGDEPPELNDDGVALVAYIQKLGTNIGDWRETFVSTRLTAGEALQLNNQQSKNEILTLGKKVYEHRCIGCHGINGDGNGTSARFLDIKPRDFTSGIFKFHSTSGADALPTDSDLYVTISHGLWGTPMPPWYTLSSGERLAVIQYIKTFSKRWQTEKMNPAIIVTTEPPVTKVSIENGRAIFQQNCALCHGSEGQGDGVTANALVDTWGNSVHPANYTLPAGTQGGVKLGHDGPHIYKTMMAGIGGTPMPPFEGTITPAQAWDLVHFIQSLYVDAHMQALKQNGLQDVDLTDARKQLWNSISEAANSGNIDTQIISKDVKDPLKVTTTNVITLPEVQCNDGCTK